MDDVAAWFLALYKTTGIKLTIFYDGYDRARFFEGFVTTVKLSAYCLVLSLFLGALAAWFAGSRVAIVRRAVTGFVALFRNTPPLVQLYFFYFALGPLLPRVGGAPMLGSRPTSAQIPGGSAPDATCPDASTQRRPSSAARARGRGWLLLRLLGPLAVG